METSVISCVERIDFYNMCCGSIEFLCYVNQQHFCEFTRLRFDHYYSCDILKSEKNSSHRHVFFGWEFEGTMLRNQNQCTMHNGSDLDVIWFRAVGLRCWPAPLQALPPTSTHTIPFTTHQPTHMHRWVIKRTKNNISPYLGKSFVLNRHSLTVSKQKTILRGYMNKKISGGGPYLQQGQTDSSLAIFTLTANEQYWCIDAVSLVFR